MDLRSSNSSSGFQAIQPAFQKYLDYCVLVTLNRTQEADIVSYQNAVSSLSVAVASLASEASLLGFSTLTLGANTTSKYTYQPDTYQI